MDRNVIEDNESVQAQAKLWNLTVGYLKSMSLKCALDLGIAEAIDNHGEAMSLSQLQSTLSIPTTKKPHLYRLLRILTHVGFLVEQGTGVGTEAINDLTPIDVFKGVHSLVDVGGGTGALSKGITENFPHVECTVLDLPQVIHRAERDELQWQKLFSDAGFSSYQIILAMGIESVIEIYP
ncbi:hypothetical protein LUZ62_049611 [Rhynchospora pubera]|uniref:O-methyltransferase n=1 Tax=Rhynchospora pubera TaxID=906938 RepID=A0AAV8FY21_9POAL|nr:hypothetical protein LUZ62_049611 [Rhynchospora pubera]